MKKLQAAMRDKAAAGWRERKLYYRVGSVFKGCFACGDYEIEESASGRERKRYVTGLEVFRSYSPKWMVWTYKCFTCGATDERCWENAIDIGKEPILGARDAVRQIKNEQRRDREKAERIPATVDQTKFAKIAQLEAELARLMRILGGAR